MHLFYSSTKVLHKHKIIYSKKNPIHKTCIVFNVEFISLKVIKIETSAKNIVAIRPFCNSCPIQLYLQEQQKNFTVEYI